MDKAKWLNEILENENIEKLMIGAMGTNGGKYPYPVVITDIVNAFAFACTHGKYLKQLILSIRLEDILRCDFDQKDMISLINNRVKYIGTAK